jgi:phosphoribosyl 1,2-cyclic phosphate phosphodiesterase
MRATILGCGPSGGVPLLGCDCAVCTSDDPRDNRTRASILVEHEGTRVLVDTAPDLRQQLLRANVRHLDAVIHTHAHADHSHGIDDIRSINFLTGAPLEAWADAPTQSELRHRFEYVFGSEVPTGDGLWRQPQLVSRLVEGPFQVGGLDIVPFTQHHGGGWNPTLGLRFGRFAYSTDVKDMPEEAFAALSGVEVWVVDCLRDRPNWAHSHLEQTLEWIARVGPRRAILTHMNHELGYTELAARLPNGVQPAYDGLVIDI